MAKILAFILVLWCGLLVGVSSSFAAVSATVNSTSVAEGATLQLVLKADGEYISEPELEDLQKYFVITGRQQSYQKSIVNGRLRSEKTWIFNIMPNKLGKLTIPAIRIGNDRTKPITIQVVKATVKKATGTTVQQIPTSAGRGQNSAAATNTVDVFIEGSVEGKNPYVQSQVVFVARLYSATKIEQGSWPPPAVVDALIEPLGEDIYFQDSRKGRIYNVVERRYAIFPQKSGSFEIPPSEFTGTVFANAPSARGLGNMMMSFGFGAAGTVLGGFGATEAVKVKSDPVTITVLPKPANFGAKWWLPAYDLKISEQFEPNPPLFKANEAVTRTITIEAIGLLAAQLPDVSFGNVKGVKIYPGKAEKSNQNSDKGIVGKVQKSEVIMPLEAGEMTIPEVKIEWWNVVAKRMETALLPARKVMVGGETFTKSGDEKDLQETVSDNDKTDVKPVSQKDFWTLRNTLLVVLVILLLGFLAVLFFLVFKKPKAKENNSFKEKSQRQYFKDLEEAINSEKDNPKQVSDALMRWARKHWEDNPPINVTEIADKLKSAELKKELEELNQSIYAKGQKNNFDKDKLLLVLKDALDAKVKQDKQIKPVPDLYPM